VVNNLRKWRRERPDWFRIHMIPDEFCSSDVFEAEGGANRRRSSMSLREIVGFWEESGRRVHPYSEQDISLVG